MGARRGSDSGSPPSERKGDGSTKLLGGDSGKKSSGGVCLLDRMFGQTSLRAVFPGLKMFRDTLLGTDFGRKIVSLYYTF